MNNSQLVWFNEVDKDDLLLVGGKGANLGEMTKAGFPIPFGFVVTSQAFNEFIKTNNLKKRIKDILTNLNYESQNEIREKSQQIRLLISSSDLPKKLINSIVNHYHDLTTQEEQYLKKKSNILNTSFHKLKTIYKLPYVAVRSSATSEDSPKASFAGQQDTYLNVNGETDLIHKIRECWASLYTDRSIYYRKQQKISEDGLGIAIVIQRMIQSEISGIAFSIDPITGNKETIVIEAVHGLGEYIVQGKVTPDYYEVNKRSMEILKKRINTQKIMLKKTNRKTKEYKIKSKIGKQQKLTDEEIIKLAIIIKDIEKHYFFPQDIEWSIENNNIFIIQSRPITTLIKSNTKKNYTDLEYKSNISQDNIIASGDPASPGIAAGKIVIIKSPREIYKIKVGDIMVAPQTDPDYVQAMKKAAAIITEKGGRTSHAAIVSRELGIPAIVGVEGLLHKLKEGQAVKVNGLEGNIYKIKPDEISLIQKNKQKFEKQISVKKLKTLTRIYVNLSEPDQAEEISKKNVDGIGLLRAEFIIADIGIHPKQFIKQNKQSEFVDLLYKKLIIFAKTFSPRPVIYRATDFKTNEYRHLKGGENYEQKEENPMLGFRGAIRYINNPDVFRLELHALKKIWEKDFRNIHLMIPFLRRPWELIKIKDIIEEEGMNELPGFKLYIMVEVPSVALELEEFLKIGVDGVSIGTNDLTMMVLGLDRDNENVSDLYDERVPSVVGLLQHIIKTCIKYKVDCGICGQAVSDYPDLVEKLISTGITSLSVNTDAIDRTRELVFNIEKRHSRKY